MLKGNNMKSILTIYENGDRYWYKNNQLHRDRGPAIERSNGAKWWYVKGKRHRLDGPAVEYNDGSKEWWVNDKQYTEREFNTRIRQYEI
jgi:hypothetical protein